MAGLASLLVAGAVEWYRTHHVLGLEWTPLRVPLTLRGGESGESTFSVTHHGLYHASIEVRRFGTSEEIGRVLGTAWFKHDGPPGVEATYDIRAATTTLVTGGTGPPWTSSSGAEFVGIGLTPTFTLDPGVRYELSVRVRKANPELRAIESRLVVAADPSRRKEAAVQAALLVPVALCLGAIGVLFVIGAAVLARRGGRPDAAT